MFLVCVSLREHLCFFKCFIVHICCCVPICVFQYVTNLCTFFLSYDLFITLLYAMFFGLLCDFHYATEYFNYVTIFFSCVGKWFSLCDYAFFFHTTITDFNMTNVNKCFNRVIIG